MDRFQKGCRTCRIFLVYQYSKLFFKIFCLACSSSIRRKQSAEGTAGRGGTRGKLDAFPIYVCTEKVPQCGYPKCETDGKEGLPLYCQLEEVTTGLKEKEKMHEKKEVAINTQVKIDCWPVNSWFFNIKKTKALSQPYMYSFWAYLRRISRGAKIKHTNTRNTKCLFCTLNMSHRSIFSCRSRRLSLQLK